MTVEENRCIRTNGIDYIFGGKLGGRPFGLIPISAQHPFTFGSLLYLRRNAIYEFLLRGGIAELHPVKLGSAFDKMDMRVIETGKQELAGGIHDFCLWTAPGIHLGAAAHCHNTVSNDGNSLGHRVLLVDSPHFGVGDDEAGGRLGLPKNERRHEKNYIKK